MKFRLIQWIFLSLLILAVPIGAQAQGSSSPQVYVMKSDGEVNTSMANYIDRGLKTAAQRGVSLVVIELNTPGGDILVMNRIQIAIRASQVPVVVYVYPAGAMAGSAGTVITLSGHLAAMAPETAIGAASPVGPQGQDLSQTESAKIKEMLKASARSMAERRGPEAVKMAEETIDAARAVSASEALSAKMVDVIARDLPDLLNQIDGRSVTMQDGTTRVLKTNGAVAVELPTTFIEQVLGLLTNPNLVFLLLAVGVQALLIELSSPGGWVAGFLGVVCLALAVYGMGLLPVNWFGIIFLITAFVLFILDIKAPTHGALTVAGLGSFILGSLVLFNSPGVPDYQRVSVPLVVVTGILTAAAFFVILSFAIRAQSVPVRTGRETMVGRTGTVRTTIAPHGTIQLGGERWSADLAEGELPIPTGSSVVVVAVQGLRLIVKKSVETREIS